jgi:DNA-binding transcriptional regulator YhcF (GntR family)
MKKDLLTVKELAAELRMSPKSIQRAYRKEEIPVQWLGRMARFDLAQVRRAMEKKAKAIPWAPTREGRDEGDGLS